MKSVFVLDHLHIQDDGEECWKRIGIYTSYDEAKKAIQRVNKLPGFSNYPELIALDDLDNKNGFNIDEYELNVDHWEDGYVTV